MESQLIQDNIAKLLTRVRLAVENYQRPQNSVSILAATKTRPAAELRAAHAAGMRAFGENYLQEALTKMEELEDLELIWHFIGPIQSNKTRAIAENFDWVHSVERAKIARRLSKQRPEHLPPLQICLQVNISGEPSKSGIAPQDLPALLQEVIELPRLRIRGLMAIPAVAGTTAQQRQPFAQLRQLQEQLKAIAPGLDTLSMGMSGDLEAAIAEGASLIRVGTDIFGPRNG
jgi:pyridoxal phosphate enzyme (YggS family)